MKAAHSEAAFVVFRPFDGGGNVIAVVELNPPPGRTT
jgi:hypothetical protein